MTVPKVKATTVQQIKQQVANTANNAGIPPFWITDWLLYVLDKPSLFLLTDDSYQLADTEFEQFNIGVTKMLQGIPLAYLTGRQKFWSLDFMVNEHTLIPRPDTEVLVEQVLLWIKAQDGVEINNNGTITQSYAINNKRLLDLGTGSGCIAISLAHELSKASWQVVAVDFSAEALKVAQYNAELNKIDNIELVQSSWYSELSTEATQLFDIIVSNPPYIDEADEHLTGLLAEPISALSAPNQGLADIEHIVEYAPQYLYSDGLLAVEHGFDQGAAVRQLFLNNGFAAIQTIQDFGGNERVTLGQIKAL
ncbi:peptide chain release factor N(5)-glutamine methyltransferase [Psychrobacter urativorans]|uniref:peptide chain release factor N(5)-glutamine methyltransferase n=1 Tax=Psychrobacter urativorans TaxID=45610 RepID=UPI00191937F6|nr:peptide chain release factor N(5)-glutamine methyltransferase [Psychrobacter urativorans]